MELPEECLRLRVYVGESESWEHRPLYEAVVVQAREAGLAGATVFRSSMGFGANSRLHTSKILHLSTDLPVVVEIVDEAQKIQAFGQKLASMVSGGLVTVEPVRVVHYSQAKTTESSGQSCAVRES